MNELSKYLVDQILLEEKKVSKLVVVYAGRFQPFHKGHFATYSHLVKKFGKDNVYIGTSNKTDKQKSPFNFKEKETVISTMFGVPKNKIVQVKNPYAPKEILSRFDDETTAFVTVVGKKDASRLGGKYFDKYKDSIEFEGYKDKGYVYIAPAQSNPISGTQVRNGLKLGSEEQKKDFFKNTAYGKYNEKIFQLITSKLNEGIEISKETIEDWLINEASATQTGAVDDGPVFWFPNLEVYNKINIDRASHIGYQVVDMVLNKNLEDYYEHPIYPNGPVPAVTFFPAGVIGDKTATNQIDIYSDKAYSDWYKHTTRKMALSGYQLVQTQLEKDNILKDKSQSGKSAANSKQLEKEFENSLSENINIPVKVGDTILTGRFKNKKTVVKNIGKDEHGMPTINGRKVVNFRLVKENFIAELFGSSVDCQKCDHSWDIDEKDPHPYLCHNCGYDNKKMEYDFDEWNKWKKSQGIKEQKRLDFYEKHFKNLVPSSFSVLRENNKIKINIPTKLNEDSGAKPYVVDLEDLTTNNENFRTTEWTGNNLQMTLMSIDNEIGLEVHESGDQFIRVEEGEGKVMMGKSKDNLDFESDIEDDSAIFIPQGYYHNIINTGDTPLKLYAIYAPPEHSRGRVDVNKPTDENINEVSSNGGYSADAGEPDTIFVTNGNIRKLGIDKGRPEYWYENGGYTQLHFPKGDYPFGKGDDKDKLSQQRKVKYKVKNVVKSDLKPPKPDDDKEIKKILEMSKSNLDKIEKYAEKQLSPEDIEFTRHFFDRLNDPRNGKEISDAELVGFFKRLSRFKKKFKEFLEKYQQIVVKDKRSDINIPFVKRANQIIAKTIMRKKDFKTSNKKLAFEVGVGTGQSGVRMGYPSKDDLKKRMKDVKDQRKKTDSDKEYQYKPVNEVSKKEYKDALINLRDEIKKGKGEFGYEATTKMYYQNAGKMGVKNKFIDNKTRLAFNRYNKKNMGMSSLSGGNKFNDVYADGLDILINSINEVSIKEYQESFLNEGGAYGHMNHPFDTDINLTFGDLKDIANRALEGNLELTREKTDGQALAISWRDDRGLIAARNKSHLKNKGKAALDINGVSSKFANRGGLTDAYNYAMEDLNKAIKSLSAKQREKIFHNGASFMNLEVIWPTSVNVIPYGQALLVFHGTMQYDEEGNAIGENQDAARILAGMIKQVNQDVQDNYTIQGPPVVELPKNQDLSSKKAKYISQISKLQKEFGLKDTDGVAEYHQAWWENFVDKKSPTTLDNKTKMGLVKRWAFNIKSFRLDKKNITDDKTLEWAKKTEKTDLKNIQKENLRKFEDIFLGIGSEVLKFTSSVLTVNPDEAIRKMKQRLDKTIKDVKKSGDPQKINKLKLELERLNAIGGPDKIVPNEGIVFVYKGKTMKLTGSFASLNQILGIFF